MQKLGITITLILLLACISSSCDDNITSKLPPEQQEYGEDSAYFLALQELEKGNTDKAIKFFTRSTKKSETNLIAKRSSEALTTIGSTNQRKHACEYLLSNYNDDETKIIAINYYKEINNNNKIIEATSSISIKETSNEIIKARFTAIEELINGNNEISLDDYLKQVEEWFSFRKLTSSHIDFYENTSVKEIKELPLIVFRIYINKREYGAAFQMLSTKQLNIKDYTPEIVSDIGKACLYGSPDIKSLTVLKEYIGESEELEFYYHFYTGRIYDRARKYNKEARKEYLIAMEKAPEKKNYDNALWYNLMAALTSSIDEAIEEIDKYKDKWDSPSYFDDFFETLSNRLFTARDWKNLYKVYKTADGYTTNETMAKYAYLSARLIEIGKIKIPNSDKETEIKNAYTRAKKAGRNFYYSILSSLQLQESDTSIENLTEEHVSSANSFTFEENPEAERLLSGYVAFELTDNLYKEWLNLKNGIGLSTAIKLSTYLNSKANDENDYYTKALRIISYAFSIDSSKADNETLKLLYPQDFKNYTEEISERFNLDEYLLYGLIRTESFFNPTVSSVAGAIGLSQLMKTTAGDIARKLKQEDYDLLDAKTNITFGAFYMEELIRRLDGSKIRALFAYNGGISNVRTWMKSAKRDFGENLPNDLFIETLPFSETRDYGKNVAAAAAIYAYLYYEKSAQTVMNEILK